MENEHTFVVFICILNSLRNFYRSCMGSYDHDRRSVSIVLQPSPFFPELYLILKMVRTRSQSENLSKDELIDEVLRLENFKNDINMKFSELNDRFNDFESKYEMVNSNLSLTRRCNDLLLERMT